MAVTGGRAIAGESRGASEQYANQQQQQLYDSQYALQSSVNLEKRKSEGSVSAGEFSSVS